MSIKKNQPARKRSYCARSAGIKGGKGKMSATIGLERLGTANVIITKNRPL